MNHSKFIQYVVMLAFVASCLLQAKPVQAQAAMNQQPWWDIQSVDTMKFSRDLAREKLYDSSFDSVIDQQVRDIAAVGATHIAIATPYDEQFVPILTRWVKAARIYNLHVWFRGNFSGWEQWFDYKKITRDQHLQLTRQFITAHADLFEDGDIFTPCPECENGGPGDPRKTGDVEGHRLFLITSYTAANEAFRQIDKKVKAGYFSMNYDVARAVMDKRTTQALGGIVTIDHYIPSASQLAVDAKAMAEYSGGKIFIGEFGAPIPDLHGRMTGEQQAQWITQALDGLAKESSVIGVNYWVNVDGSTQLWNSDTTARPAVASLHAAYAPKQIIGHVVNQYRSPIMNATVSNQYKSVKTDKSGFFALPILDNTMSVIGKYNDYPIVEIHPESFLQDTTIVIQTNEKHFWENILQFFKQLFLF